MSQLLLIMALLFSYSCEILKDCRTSGKQKDAFCSVSAVPFLYKIPTLEYKSNWGDSNLTSLQ